MHDLKQFVNPANGHHMTPEIGDGRIRLGAGWNADRLLKGD